MSLKAEIKADSTSSARLRLLPPMFFSFFKKKKLWKMKKMTLLGFSVMSSAACL